MTTDFFGLISIGNILLGSTELNFFLLNIICLVGSLRNILRINKVAFFLVLFVGIFYAYGLLRPIQLGEQSIMMSIKASKSFSFYFFFCYILTFYRRIDFDIIFRLIYKVAIYFSIIYIIDLFIPVSFLLQGYHKETILDQRVSLHIQCHYDSYIYFALGIINGNFIKLSRSTKLLSNILFIIGIYIGGYFSLLFCSVCLIVYSYIIDSWKRFSFGMKILFGGICIAFFLVICLYLFDINSIIQSRVDALESRDSHNEIRVLLITQQLIWGYGFLSQNSPLILKMTSDAVSQYSSGLSFIDAGYIDLAGRFGILGTILFLLYPVFAIYKLYDRHYQIFIFIIISFYAINLTWSVFSFQMGIIVISLIFGSMMQYKTSLNQASKYHYNFNKWQIS